MKKIFRIFGIITLVCFSFFYTDRVMNVISDIDPLKNEIINLSKNYILSSNEAVITKDTIIPGTNGRKVNIDKSYKKMRINNVFNDNLLVFDTIYPLYKLEDNLDKYVIRGNINKKSVSIIFIINNNNSLEKLNNITSDIKLNLFISYEYLFNNINKVKNYNKYNIYPYSDKYSYETLLIANNILERIGNNKSKYCLSIEKDKDNLNTCSYLNMNTIIPNINGGYNEITKNLVNGSIILINNINELSYISNFIKSKGYNIVSLEDLLNEYI